MNFPVYPGSSGASSMPLVCDALAPHSWHCFTHIRSSRASTPVVSSEQDPKPSSQTGGSYEYMVVSFEPSKLAVLEPHKAARTHSSGLNRRSHVGRSNPQQASWKISHIHKDAGAAKPVISGVPNERALFAAAWTQTLARSVILSGQVRNLCEDAFTSNPVDAKVYHETSDLN